MFKYDIKKRRLELDLTLEDVGKAVGVGKSTVRKWETGYIENMKTDKIERLSKALKITPEEFMGWAENVEPTPLTKQEQRLLDDYIRAKNSNNPAVKALLEAIDKLLETGEPKNDKQD